MRRSERSIARQHYRAHRKLPDKIENAPKLLAGLQAYLTAYLNLDRERAIGYAGKEPIKQRDMIEYAERNGYDEDQVDRLVELLTRVDNAYLSRLASKRAEQNRNKGK